MYRSWCAAQTCDERAAEQTAGGFLLDQEFNTKQKQKQNLTCVSADDRSVSLHNTFKNTVLMTMCMSCVHCKSIILSWLVNWTYNRRAKCMLKVKNYSQYGHSQWAFHPQIKMLSNVEFYFWANCVCWDRVRKAIKLHPQTFVWTEHKKRWSERVWHNV